MSEVIHFPFTAQTEEQEREHLEENIDDLKEEMLDYVDRLRNAIETNQIRAFAAVGLGMPGCLDLTFVTEDFANPPSLGIGTLDILKNMIFLQIMTENPPIDD